MLKNIRFVYDIVWSTDSLSVLYPVELKCNQFDCDDEYNIAY